MSRTNDSGCEREVIAGARRAADKHKAEMGLAGSKPRQPQWREAADRAENLHRWRGHRVVGDRHTD
jgi:hypothetical protein